MSQLKMDIIISQVSYPQYYEYIFAAFSILLTLLLLYGVCRLLWSPLDLLMLLCGNDARLYEQIVWRGLLGHIRDQCKASEPPSTAEAATSNGDASTLAPAHASAPPPPPAYRPSIKLNLRFSSDQPPVTCIAVLDSGASLSLVSSTLVDQEAQKYSLKSGLIWPMPCACYPGTAPSFIYRSIQVRFESVANASICADNVNLFVFDRCCCLLSPSRAVHQLAQTRFGVALSNDSAFQNNTNDNNNKPECIRYQVVIGQDLLSSLFLNCAPVQKNLFLTSQMVIIQTRFGNAVQGTFDDGLDDFSTDEHYKGVTPEFDLELESLESRPLMNQEMVRDLNSALNRVNWLSCLVDSIFYAIPRLILFGIVYMSLCVQFLVAFSMTRLLCPVLPYCPTFIMKSMTKMCTTLGSVLLLCIVKARADYLTNIEPFLFGFAVKRCCTLERSTFVYVPTLAVRALSHAKWSDTWAIFDSGSDISIISSSLVDKLDCLKIPVGPNDHGAAHVGATHSVVIRLQSLDKPEESVEVKLLVHPNDNFYDYPTPSPMLLQLIHQHFGITMHQPNEPQMHILLGTDIVTSKLLLPESKVIHLLPDLRLCENKLGWTLEGARIGPNGTFVREMFNSVHASWRRLTCREYILNYIALALIFVLYEYDYFYLCTRICFCLIVMLFMFVSEFAPGATHA